MDIEQKLIKLYYDFITQNSIFGSKVLIVPKTPQSFSLFPTIVFTENNNVNIVNGKSTNYMEYVDRLTYTVEFYTKDIVFNGVKYNSLQVQSELKKLTFQFFNDIGFIRMSSQKAEYMDINVDRNVSVFQGKINNWNGHIN